MRKILRLSVCVSLALAASGCLGFGVRIGGFGAGFGRVSSADPTQPTASGDPTGIRTTAHVLDIELHDDFSLSAIVERSRTIETTAGLRPGQRTEVTFDPASQEIELLEAHVVRPDGLRIPVTAENVFTRPSAAAQDAPGFVGTHTTTVLFPQVSVGSQTFVRWRFHQSAPSRFGFDWVYRPDFSLPLDDVVITLTAPADAGVRWGERGGFDVSEDWTGDRHVLTARLRDYEGGRREPGMVSAADVVPLFVVSTVKTWEQIGAAFHGASEASVEATAAIDARAAEIVGDLTREDAARAIHRWVCRNNAYVAVHLGAGDAWVPHRASEVLQNGYGDCKDKYALLASLLRSRNIDVEAVLIDRNRAYETLPIPTSLQFDHCIAYLPEFGVYVDPTDRFTDYGELPVGLRGKLVVHATPDGRVARTPDGRAEHNLYEASHRVILTADGTLEGMSAITASGAPARRMRSLLAVGDETARAEDLLVQTPEGGTGALESTDPTDLATSIACRGTWRSERAVEMGARTYFTLPVGIDFAVPQRARGVFSQDERRYPVVLGTFDIRWVHRVELPAGHAIERLPEVRDVLNGTGLFSSRYEREKSGGLLVERRLRIDRDLVGADDYPAVRELLEAFFRDSRSTIVLTQTGD